MKITKFLMVTLALCLIITAFASCKDKSNTPEYEELKLKTNEIVTCKNDGWELKGIIDYDNSNISESDTVTVNSTAESIAKFENNKIMFGSKYGEATLDIIVGNKKGTLSVKVVPYIEYLYSLANKNGASGFDKMDYYASNWLISNLSAFKNPASVSVEDVLYVDGTITSTGFNANYLIMEIRAQNSFGGYGVNYYKVSAGRIEEVTISSYGGLFKSYNGLDLYTGGSYSVNKAVKEYIADNY